MFRTCQPFEVNLLESECDFTLKNCLQIDHRSQPQSVYSRDKFLHKVGNSKIGTNIAVEDTN